MFIYLKVDFRLVGVRIARGLEPVNKNIIEPNKCFEVEKLFRD